MLDRRHKYNNYLTFYHPDIDECAVQNNPCDDVANSVCNNTHGSYFCQCKDGFVKNGEICEGTLNIIWFVKWVSYIYVAQIMEQTVRYEVLSTSSSIVYSTQFSCYFTWLFRFPNAEFGELCPPQRLTGFLFIIFRLGRIRWAMSAGARPCEGWRWVCACNNFSQRISIANGRTSANRAWRVIKTLRVTCTLSMSDAF